MRFIKKRMEEEEKRKKEKKKKREEDGITGERKSRPRFVAGRKKKKMREKQSAIPLHEREGFKKLYCDF